MLQDSESTYLLSILKQSVAVASANRFQNNKGTIGDGRNKAVMQKNGHASSNQNEYALSQSMNGLSHSLPDSYATRSSLPARYTDHSLPAVKAKMTEGTLSSVESCFKPFQRQTVGMFGVGGINKSSLNSLYIVDSSRIGKNSNKYDFIFKVSILDLIIVS